MPILAAGLTAVAALWELAVATGAARLELATEAALALEATATLEPATEVTAAEAISITRPADTCREAFRKPGSVSCACRQPPGLFFAAEFWPPRTYCHENVAGEIPEYVRWSRDASIFQDGADSPLCRCALQLSTVCGLSGLDAEDGT